jgi:hypothetical protein
MPDLLHRLHICIVVAAFVLVGPGSSLETRAAPIQRIKGLITEVGEGYLWLKPEDGSRARKLILRWKARFIPPKLPLKGDRVLILYKDKDEGAIIYGVQYLSLGRGGEPPSGSR